MKKLLVGLFAACISLAGADPSLKAVFVKDSQIWISDGDGKNGRQLTRDEDVKSLPTWSPSGTLVAFVRGDSKVKGGEIVIVDHLGAVVSERAIQAGDSVHHMRFVESLCWISDRELLFGVA